MKKPEINFECPQCKQALTVSIDRIGTQVTCPACSKPVTVPGNAALPVAKKAGGINPLAIAAVVLLAIFVALFACWVFRSSKTAPSNPDSTQSASQAAPADAQSPSGVDERLFLMNLLQAMYLELPTNLSDPDSFHQELQGLRTQASQHYDDITQKNLDARLAGAYADFISAVDDYNGLMAAYNRIENASESQAENDSFNAGLEAGSKGASTYDEARDNGSAKGDAFAQGAAVGVVQYLWDSYNSGKERDAQKQQALQNATQDFQNKFSDYWTRVQNTARDLSQKYSWAQGEAGFDGTENRSHDPFLICRLAYGQTLDDQHSVDECVDFALQCSNAITLIPDGLIYNQYRANCLWMAGDILNRTSVRAIGDQPWGTANSPVAAQAVQVWKACLDYTSDPDGECRERLAWALMCSSDLQAALTEANSISSLRSKTIRYALNMACLENDLNDTATSIQWLEYLVQTLGYSDIPHLKTNKDLEAVRTAEKDRFDALTTLKCYAGLDFGVMLDDVLLTNNSAFPITHVVFNATITSGGNVQKTLRLTSDQIGAGQVCRWTDVAQVPNDSSISGNLNCDQDPQ